MCFHFSCWGMGSDYIRFLYASLQLDALKQCTSSRQVKERLKEFPPTIEDVFLQQWRRAGTYDLEVLLARNVLLWVLTSARCMRVEELQSAIATSPQLQRRGFNQNVYESRLIAVCNGLIKLDEQSRLIYLSRESNPFYLATGDSNRRLQDHAANDALQSCLLEAFPHPHTDLAEVCLRHLSSSGFQRTELSCAEELESTLNGDALLAYSYDAWAFHSNKALDETPFCDRLAAFVAGCRAFPAIIHEGREFEVLGPLHVSTLFDFPIALAGFTPNQKPPHALRLLDNVAGRSSDRDPNTQTRNLGLTPLVLACRVGSTRAAAELLDLPHILANQPGNDGWTALHWAAWHGYEEIIKKLLVRPEIQVNLVNKAGHTPVALASRNGCTGTVQLFLKHPRIDLTIMDSAGRTASMLASQNGRTATVALLLTHPHAFIIEADKAGQTALMLAAQAGHTSTVQLLLTLPSIDVSKVNSSGKTALMLASDNGHATTVKCLLAHRSPPNPSSRSRCS
jgi:ankyrin repeat protein